MISVSEIRQKLATHRSELQRFKVSELSLFGSAAREESTATDLDFMAVFTEPPGLLDFMGLKFFLEDLFQMPVDLHSKGSCPQRFLKRIQDELQHVA